MLPWMLGGLAIIGFFAWRVIYNAEQDDKRAKEARRSKGRN